MSFRLCWSEDADAHIAKHGVTRQDVRDTLRRRHDWRNHGRRVIGIGKSNRRYLFIVLEPSEPEPGFFEVPTARDASRLEKRLFVRRVKGFR